MDNITGSNDVLLHLYEYDSFLDSITTIADMGCGASQDINWWATLTTRDDPPVPHNYKCYAVDRDASKLADQPDLPNVIKLNKDFTKICLPVKVDVLCAYDCLQYSTNPLDTLKIWNQQMNVDGMLVLNVKQQCGVSYNTYYSRTYSECFFNYTPTNLIYMLAVNGFDCRDAYLLKKFNDPWIRIAVYKSNIPPMDPATTSWTDLIDKGLLHPSVVASIVTNGHLRQEDIVYPWLDRENYFIDYVSQWTEIPEEAGPPTIDGVFNTVSQSTETTVQQAPIRQKDTKITKSVGVMRPPKKYT